MPANVHFLRKLAKDELWDTMFFATGEYPLVEKTKDHYIMKVQGIDMKICHIKKIYVNGDLCRSVPEAKYVIQQGI
jgi:hypothetical protein